MKEFTDIKYFSIIVFTTKADLKVTTQTNVVYTTQLLKIIKNNSTIQTVSDTDKEKIYTKLLALNVDSKDNRKAHIQSIRNSLSETNINIEKNICPKCSGRLVLRNGKYGQFKGCNNFPKCKFTEK